MTSNILEISKLRRSRYAIAPESTLTDKQLGELMEQALVNTPSAFNSQSNRAILLLNENHQLLWSIVLGALKAIVPPERFDGTSEKIAGFAMGYGTILYFIDEDTVSDMQKTYPLYADKFASYAEQSAGMLQYLVWTALSEAGMGASLQHYNPLIDKEVSKQWDIKQSWRLISQMPFGKPTAPPQKKSSLPIEQLFRQI